MIFWIAPGVAAVGLGIMVRVSIRVNNTQEAQQLGGAVVLPLVILAVGQTTALLLAGNGHVRRDYGVPVLLDALASARKTITVGFLESDKTFELHDAALKARYDFIWITNPATREDPCLNFPKR